MAERQIGEINSGLFGVFNGSPTRSSSSRTPTRRDGLGAPEEGGERVGKGKSGFTAMEDGSDSDGSVQSLLRRGGERTGEVDSGADEDSLFIPETQAHQKPTEPYDTAKDPDLGTDSDLQGLSPERTATQTGDNPVPIAEKSVRDLKARHDKLTQQLASLDSSAAWKIEKIRFAKEDAIRQVVEEAERDIARVRVWVAGARGDYEELRDMCRVEMEKAEERYRGVTAGVGEKRRRLDK